MTATYLVFVDAPKKPKDTIASKYERAVVNTFPLSFLFTDTVPSLDIFSKCCFVIFKQLINNTTIDWFTSWPQDALTSVGVAIRPIDDDKRSGK